MFTNKPATQPLPVKGFVLRKERSIVEGKTQTHKPYDSHKGKIICPYLRITVMISGLLVKIWPQLKVVKVP